MGGGSAPKAAKPTPAELELQQQQVNLLADQKAQIEQNTRQQNLLAPYIYEQAGLKPTFGATTYGAFDAQRYLKENPDLANNKYFRDHPLEHWQQYGQAEGRSYPGSTSQEITGFEKLPQTPADPEAAQIEQLLQERTLAALKGELPVDSGLMNELDTQQKQLEQRLEKQLGTGYATSSPGIEALANFQKNKSALLDSARRGDLTLGEQLGIAQQQANQSTVGNTLNQAVVNQGLVANAGSAGMGTIGSLFNLNQGYAQALQNLQQGRNITIGAIGPGVGQVAAGVGMGALSGAAAGTTILPGWGTAIGAIGGAIAGGVSASRRP